MSLDDAVTAARAKQEQQAQSPGLRVDQEVEIQELAREAVKRLRVAPRSEQFVQVRAGAMFADYLYERRGFKAVRQERCWVLSTGTASRTPTTWAAPSRVLILESGEVGRIYREKVFERDLPGEFITELPLAPLPSDDPFFGGPGGSHASRVGVLKEKLAEAIVTYGAA
ncbi:hypothetical protein ABZ635_26505 [Nocardiopsis sp. NPDC007018]|uniref:hypothetical protein n=1 Tax=Nocardiopsis sp. NPDC007018 TaxID=3155721 RepID=UPI00340E446A